LAVDKKGLRYDVDLPDTAAAKDVRTLIKRGDVSGSSFAFRVEDDKWDEGKTDKKSGTRTLPLRTILRAELFDVSPVTYPAYPTTSVSARSKAEAARDAAVRAEADAEAEKTPEIIAREQARARIALARAQAV
jgi:HK97 family phage prohead protease